ncbi:type II secretion system F family protein [Treponema sp. OttesenSCG-928-L16]|nr:type II secretion system F family protein [Treponema sp. OttesenSCG-928-L16]
MPYYRCVAAGMDGGKYEIIKQAADARELAGSFGGSESFLVSYTPVEESLLYKTKKRFGEKTVLEFTEIMAALLKSGNTIQDSLSLCASMTSPKTKKLCEGFLEGIRRGEAFHRVLRNYDSSFSPLYQTLVRLGEKTGSAAGVFERMSVYLRTERKMRRKISNALMYPALVLSAAFAGCIGIAVFILPRMAELFSAFEAGGAVPGEMAGLYRLLWLSPLLLGIAAVLTAALLLVRKKSCRAASALDRLILTVPVIGSFLLSMHTLDFAFAMEMLTGAGITVTNALRESAAVVRNRAFRNALLDVYTSILAGTALSAAFMERRIFPAYIGTWVHVGERTGSVEAVFSRIRDFFQNDIEYNSERLMNLLEPALILLAGVIVLVLVVQFVLPLFSLYGAIV